MKKIIVFIAGLVFSLVGASAQSHSVEFLGGYSMQPFTLKGEACTALGVSNGGNEYLRYTYFLNEHFGVFAQEGIETVSCSDGAFFGAMNKADGEKYLYRFSDWKGYSNEMVIFSVGAAYRWDSGIFRFTPRAAVGVGTFCGFDYSYERRSRDNSTGPEYFSFAPVGNVVSYDYLIDRGESYTEPSILVLSADFQISVMPSKRVYFFIQPGMTFAPFPVHVEQTKFSSVHRYDPVNWAEALAYSDMADSWMRDGESEAVSVESFFVSPFFHLNFGIGINFGYKNNR